MNEHNLERITHERLEHGRKLRESTTLIKCIAIVEFNDGTNWQWVHANIPPEKINSEGYVEEVQIANESLFIHKEKVDGEVYSLIHPNWLVTFNTARITKFEISDQKPRLLPSSNLIVRYRMPK